VKQANPDIRILGCALAGAVLLGLMAFTAVCHAQGSPVELDKTGRLAYHPTAMGDRVGDFSYAGYRGGGIPLPVVATKRTVTPSSLPDADDTKAIQDAIDEVSAMPMAGGTRGAVRLEAGTFHCSGTIRIAASGVVLRGAGVDRTTIQMTGSPHLALKIEGRIEEKQVGASTVIADTYVPSGTMSFRVKDATGFKVGDIVSIVKVPTPEWIHFMGMDTLGVRNGKLEHWVEGRIKIRRRITKIAGDTLTVDVPLMDSYDARYLGEGTVEVRRVEVSGQIEEVGVEDLKVAAPARSIALQKDAEFDGMTVADVRDGWVKGVGFAETTNSVSINHETERMTFEGVDVVQHIPVTTAAKPFDFSCDGTQILFDRCSGSGDRVFYVATQSRQQGPVVVLHSKFLGGGAIEPHQRWSTGLLVDNCDVPDGSIQFVNRGTMGTGHGWAMGWGMVWNSSAVLIVIQQPPGTVNWSVGNKSVAALAGDRGVTEGAPEVTGLMKGTRVLPESLYLQQLKERMGSAAVKAIGY
jgi:hypothetical protein